MHAAGPHTLYHRVALTAPIGHGQEGPPCMLSRFPESTSQRQTHAHKDTANLRKIGSRCSPGDHRASRLRSEQQLLARVTDPSHEQAHAVCDRSLAVNLGSHIQLCIYAECITLEQHKSPGES